MDLEPDTRVCELKSLFSAGWNRPWNVYDMESFLQYFPELRNQKYLLVEDANKWDRNIGIGASEIASAANVHHAYLSRKALFQLKKRGNVPDPSTSFILEWGNTNEPLVRLLVMTLFAPLFEVVFHPSIIVAPFHPQFFCSPDDVAILANKKIRTLIEYKCPYSCVPYAEVPDHHYSQLLSNMKILQCKVALYCVWVPHELRLWCVPFNEDAWSCLYSRARQFLDDYFNADVVPPRSPTGHKLYQLYPKKSRRPPLCIPLESTPQQQTVDIELPITGTQQLEDFFVAHFETVSRWFNSELDFLYSSEQKQEQ